MAESALPARRHAEWRPTTIRRVPVEWYGFGAGAVVLGLLVCFVKWGGYLQYMVAGFVGKWVSALLVDRQMSELRDDPKGGQFAATLVLKREVPYGYDEGLVAFEDGWLVFQGHRCTFSVGAGDVVKPTGGSGNVGFHFEAPGGFVEAVLKTRTDSRFTQAVKAWRAAQKASEGSVLPPILPNEEAARAGRMLVQSALVVGLPLAAGFVLWGDHFNHGFVPIVVVVAVLCAKVRAAEIGDALGRLERGEPRRRRFWESSRRPSLEADKGT